MSTPRAQAAVLERGSACDPCSKVAKAGGPWEPLSSFLRLLFRSLWRILLIISNSQSSLPKPNTCSGERGQAHFQPVVGPAPMETDNGHNLFVVIFNGGFEDSGPGTHEITSFVLFSIRQALTCSQKRQEGGGKQPEMLTCLPHLKLLGRKD